MINRLTTNTNNMRGATINVSWLFFDRIFRILSAMFVGVWMARYLGPEQYGTWSYAFLFPTSLAAFANLGFTNTMITLLVQSKNDKIIEILGTAFGLRLLSGFICYGFIIVISYFINQNDKTVQILVQFTGVSLIFQVFEIFELFFQSNTESKRSVWAKTIAFTIGISIKIFLLLGHYNLQIFALTVIIEYFISSSLLVYFYSKYSNISILKWNFNISTARQLIKLSWPLMLSESMIYAYMRIDQFMIHQLTNNRELGCYMAALRISESWYFIAGVISGTFYPNIASYWETNNELFHQKYQKLQNRLTAIAFLAALSITIMSPIITNILFGNRFIDVGRVLSIHVWTGIPIFMGVGATNIYILNKLQKLSLYRTILGVIINIILNIWLIPIYGAIGASVATLTTQTFTSYLINYLTPSTKVIFKMQSTALKNVLLLRTKMII